MENYKNTPSFYNTKEVFQKYLARTSYYTVMQDAVCKIVKHCNPKTILELGSGTGSTACRLAKENKNSFVMAVDMRENMVDIGQEISHEKNIKNIDFVLSEMVDYIEKQGELSEIIVLLYSFHHIPDPDENKIKFLRLCKSKLPKDGKICIAETFLPDCSNRAILNSKITECWSKRILEGYSSTFWASLDGVSYGDIERAREIANFSMEHEKKAGELVLHRDNEYLVSMNWLLKQANSLGYNVEIAEPCNSVGDAVVLLSLNTKSSTAKEIQL